MGEENRTCGTCADEGCTAREKRPGERDEDAAPRRAIAARMCRIGRKILVLSGKGGVGKSTVAVNLAAALAARGRRVGLLDVDIHGPSVPTLLGLQGRRLEPGEGGVAPIEAAGLKVVSIGFLLERPEDAVVWRGPMKMKVIEQFLKDVAWGDLDDLVIDSPPGTGDEPLSVIQFLGRLDGAVVVTTPQEVSIADVRRSVSFCRTLEAPILGIVENMSGFLCPHCGKATDVFARGGGEALAAEAGVPFLGRIPLDPRVVESGDHGRPFALRADSPAAEAFAEIVRRLGGG